MECSPKKKENIPGLFITFLTMEKKINDCVEMYHIPKKKIMR